MMYITIIGEAQIWMMPEAKTFQQVKLQAAALATTCTQTRCKCAVTPICA